MPRDGAGVYTQPFPEVVEGTTIESVKYNGNVNDVEQDLNTPRPIVAGGTGANNAADAMSNLGGEGSKIQVTNYDSHNFTAGSFYSLASATAPPVAGHAFAGICYPAVVSGVATSDMFIEVRDRDEPNQPGSQYVRQKKAGVWSGWQKAEGTAMGGTPPAAPANGMFWWDPTRGKLFVFYSDPNTSQWVEAVATPDMNPDDFVRIDVAQTLTEAEKTQARSNIYAAPFDALAYSGMQINGSMEVSQEFGSTSIPVAGSKKILDGYIAVLAGAGASAATQQITSAPPGISNSLVFQCTTANPLSGAGDIQFIYQPIEGYRWSRLGFGAVGAQPVTVSFWVTSNVSGTMAVSLRNGVGDRSYVTDVSVVASVWNYRTVTIPGYTLGTWEKGNLAGATLSFCFGSGSTFKTAANTWTAGNFLATPATSNFFVTASNAVYLTGVVVLPGIEAPSAERSPLIMRPFDQELVTCQRYLPCISGTGTEQLGFGMVNTAAEVRYFIPFTTPTRVAPTGLAVENPVNMWVEWPSNAGGANTGGSNYFIWAGTSGGYFGIAVAGAPVGYASNLRCNGPVKLLWKGAQL
jgi:hypothetical protein